VILPDALVEALRRPVEIGQPAQAFALITVDEGSTPHVALLSGRELAVAPDRTVHAVLAGRRTRAHVEARREATLVGVEGETCHTLVLRLRTAVEAESLLVVVFDVAEHRGDSVGIGLSPVTYVPTRALALAEHWDRAGRLLTGSLDTTTSTATSRRRRHPDAGPPPLTAPDRP
jgi:hypothetical protein